ncbi:hypothetical protein PoHVEF18_007041 [Penicillium ochrochloron]
MAPKIQAILALDFGTTYSGVAWAQVSNPSSHYLINEWPVNMSGSIGGMTSEKVPTEIAFTYERGSPNTVWGFQIPEVMPRLQWFKLGLDPDQKAHIMPALAIQHKDWRKMDYPHHATPETVTTDYLRALTQHVHKLLKAQLGVAFDSMSFSYVITVPAMWSEKAKAELRKCAENAGLGDCSSICIISEPEAAAIHALRASNPTNLQAGDTVLLIDAGGGTVDLITFTIEQRLPILKLRESAAGTGAYCGSTYLNRRFEDFIRQRLESCSGWDQDTLEQAMMRFEACAKRTFTGDTSDDFHFPVPGIPDDEGLHVRRGFLRVTGEEMREIFVPVLDVTVQLALHQIRSSKSPVKTVLIVGGFGQNQFLRQHVRDNIPSSVTVLAPPDGWTAVVKGALAKMLSSCTSLAPQISIQTRVARKHYGFQIKVPFNPLQHDESRKYVDPFYGQFYILVMNWFIRKGDEIDETRPIITRWWKQQLKSQGRPTTIQVSFYEYDGPDDVEAPLYLNDDLRMHARLDTTFDPTLRLKIPLQRGRDGNDHYNTSFEFHAHYFSAHCQVSLWFEGQHHGAVQITYV